MKTPLEVLHKYFHHFKSERTRDLVVKAMEDYAKIYHDSEVKKLNIPVVSNSALYNNSKLIDNMCISYRHDFGLMKKEQQDRLRFECKEWLRAYENNREHCC